MVRENILESIRAREDLDREMAENLVKKEAQINKLYNPNRVRPLNIHEESVKKAGH